jgi:hypothetical protein
MNSKAANHLHRYRKVNLGRRPRVKYLVYKCIKPACSHYVPMHLAEGQLCECNRCGQPMIIGKIQLTGSSQEPMARPHCVDCIKRRKTDETTVAAITDFLEK